MKRTFIRRLLVLACVSALAWGGATRLYAAHVGVTFSIGAPPPMAYQPFPPSPGPNYAWQPGYWAMQPQGWVWVPGQWAVAPGPGTAWVPGGWDRHHDGYHWHEGYWRGGHEHRR